MKSFSKSNERILYAYSNGYRVTENGEVKTPQGGFRKLGVSTTGYLSFNMAKPSHGRVFVHRLAGFQKFGEVIFLDEIQVRHLDGDTKNNRLSNISVGTASDNALNVPKELRVEKAKRAASHLRKLSSAQVEALRKDRRKGFSYRELSAKHGISISSISYILNGKMYQDT